MNKRINIGNYEAFLLDYLEGNLDPLLIKEMEDFLGSHPEIAREVDGIEKLTLQAEDISFPDTASLYQAEAAIAEEQAMELFSRAADKSLDNEEAKELSGFLKANPSYEIEYRAYMATRLPVDDNIAYPDKPGLKKTIPLYQRPFVQNVSRIAAIFLVLAISVWYFLQPGSSTLPDMPSMDNLSASAGTLELPAPQQSVEQLAAVAPEGSSSELGSGSNIQEKRENMLASNVEKRTKGSGSGKGNPAGQNMEDDRSSLEGLASIYDNVRVLNTRNHFKPEYAIHERISLMDLQWLTADPLFAESVSEDEPLFRANLSWLLASKKEDTATVRQRERNFNLWGLADAGITAINVLTDNEIELRKDLDDDGNVVSYALVSDGLQIARKQKLE